MIVTSELAVYTGGKDVTLSWRLGVTEGECASVEIVFMVTLELHVCMTLYVALFVYAPVCRADTDCVCV